MEERVVAADTPPDDGEDEQGLTPKTRAARDRFDEMVGEGALDAAGARQDNAAWQELAAERSTPTTYAGCPLGGC